MEVRIAYLENIKEIWIVGDDNGGHLIHCTEERYSKTLQEIRYPLYCEMDRQSGDLYEQGRLHVKENCIW